VPVANVHNQSIADLPNSVNLQNGEVEFSADFIAVRPKDSAKGNGTLLLENPNRGHSRILSLVDVAMKTWRTALATHGSCATVSR